MTARLLVQAAVPNHLGDAVMALPSLRRLVAALLARSPDLQLVVSNTTEIGITDDPDERASLSDYDRGQAIVGTVEQVVEELHEFADAGLTQIVGLARLPGRPNTVESTLESIEFTMTEIAPHLK